VTIESIKQIGARQPDISDEQACAQRTENAYFQFFCGETYLQTKLPLDRTSMSVWRGRIGAEKLELHLAETLAAATQAKAVDKSQMERVTVGATAQTKAMAASDGQPSAAALDRMAE
jgi:IS5 family transposase